MNTAGVQNRLASLNASDLQTPQQFTRICNDKHTFLAIFNANLTTQLLSLPLRTRATRRNMSSGQVHTGMPTTMAELRNNIWLSDPGAYPVIAVVTFACGMSASFITYCCVKNPDVRITPGRRQALVRSWE
jgi:hypothetical protein